MLSGIKARLDLHQRPQRLQRPRAPPGLKIHGVSTTRSATRVPTQVWTDSSNWTSFPGAPEQKGGRFAFRVY